MLSWLFPTHTSSHSLILDSKPTCHLTLESNQPLSCPTLQTSFKSFLNLDLYLFIIFPFRFYQEPYFNSKTSFPKPVFAEHNFHFHLASKALLKSSMCLIPNPLIVLICICYIILSMLVSL